MTKTEALRLALDAFGEIDWCNNSQWQSDRAKVAIASLKEALAQQEQDGECKHCTDGCPACDARKLPEQDCIEPDYKELWQQMCERCDSLDKKLAQQDAILENHTARIVDLQTHIDNLEGKQ